MTARRAIGRGLALALLAACGGERAPQRAPPPFESREHLVVIRMTDAMRFVPQHPSVAIGDTVVWINAGAMPHTATDRPGTAGVEQHNVLPAGAEPWDSGLLEPGAQFRLVLTVEGEYTYLCYLHEAAGMIGYLTVRGSVTDDE